MKKSLNYFFLILFSANYSFASKFYVHAIQNKNNKNIFVGDLSFSYSLSNSSDGSIESIEQGQTRITIQRNSSKSQMSIEQKTTLGFLTLTYQNVKEKWEYTDASFRKYETHYKDSANDDCSVPPVAKNQIDLKSISEVLEKQNYGSILFDKSCKEKLSKEEYENIVAGTQELFTLGDLELNRIKDPAAVQCLVKQGANGPVYAPFNTLKNKVTLAAKNSLDAEEVKKNTSLPFPIVCDFDSKSSNKCGSMSEGIKNKIIFNINCLRKNPSKIKSNTQDLFIHEFAHTIRSPNALKENQLKDISVGKCEVTKVYVTDSAQLKQSKENISRLINSEQTGAKTIGNDVANPYAGFAETTSANQTTTIASNNNNSFQETGSGTSTAPLNTGSSQRAIASTTTFTNTPNTASTISGVNTKIPSLREQAQYVNTKAYVNAAIGTVAKKIAPIVSYVESPAFAATLPAANGPTDFSQSNSGNVAGETGAVAKAAPANRAGGNTEVGTSSPGGSGGSGYVASPAAGSSGGADNARLPAAVKNGSRGNESEFNLENAYALKVRKRLVSEAEYRDELRKKGIQIHFADGYKFETNGSKIQYTEKNGVLVRGN